MSKTIPYEHDIFLSYNKADEAWVERLATRLEQEEWQGDNLKVFLPRGILALVNPSLSELKKHYPKAARSASL
jgi:hypothetical protein